MYIMTEQGWRPLVSYADYWAGKHAEVAKARAALEAAYQLPHRTDPERDNNHNAIMKAYAALSKAQDAMLS